VLRASACLWASRCFTDIIVLIPLLALTIRPVELGLAGSGGDFYAARTGVLAPVFRHGSGGGSDRLLFGLVIAWVLVRYRFLAGLLDAVICLCSAHGSRWYRAVHPLCAQRLDRIVPGGVRSAAYTPWGVLVAMIFISLPFTVRTVQLMVSWAWKWRKQPRPGRHPHPDAVPVVMPMLGPAS
jgi:sulfate transport system permease protein